LLKFVLGRLQRNQIRYVVAATIHGSVKLEMYLVDPADEPNRQRVAKSAFVKPVVKPGR
jgi:hypothetical protein